MADEPYLAQDQPSEARALERGADGPADEETAAPRPWWYRAALAALAVAVVLFLVPPLAHVFFPPVNPHQGPPPGHFASGCWACHDVSASVPVRNFD